MVAAAVLSEHVDYMPRGGCRAFYTATDPEVLAVGPAGTGKTMAACWKLHHTALRVPGMRILMVRKVLEDLKAGALATYTNHVKPELDGVITFGGNRFYPGEFRYPNGSVLHVVGMDKPGKVMSAEYDMAYVNEATELTEEDWESLKSRLRNGKLAYQQLIGDCNPAGPRHWLRVRCDKGLTRYIQTTHKDNPAYWDDGINDWTTLGYSYVQQTLQGLTGVRRKRLFEGVWAGSEGVVYPDFDFQQHAKTIDCDGWSTVLGVDVGTRNPTAILTVRKASDDRRHVQREVYRRGMSSDEIVEAIAAEADATKPDAIFMDPSANDYILALERKGYPARKANNDVIFGIGEVTSAFVAGLTIDPSCENLIAEIETYHYPDGKLDTDKPVKEFDHACFVAGTMVQTAAGAFPIETIRPGDSVTTSEGERRVLLSGITASDAEVLRVEFSDGSHLVGTANHPIAVVGEGWKPLDTLRYGDIILSWNQRASNSTELSLGATPTRRAGLIASTTRRTELTERRVLAAYTKRFGNPYTARYQKDATSTTQTSMDRTTTPTISNASPKKSTSDYIPSVSPNCLDDPAALPISTLSVPSLLSGTHPKRAASGIGGMAAMAGLSAFLLLGLATSAALSSRTSHYVKSRGSVQTSARARGAVHRELTTKHASAQHAASRLARTSTVTPDAAPVFVLSVSAETVRQPVYNLLVKDTHEYFANGALVHNCDALRYALASEPPVLEGRLVW